MTQRVLVPFLTDDQARGLGRRLVRHYHIGWPQLLENSGRALADLSRRLLGGEVVDRPIVVLAGSAQSGGSAMAAARYLLNWGAWVQVVCSIPTNSYRSAPAQQLSALQAMGAALAWAEDGWELPPCDLLIDAVLSYSPRFNPAGSLRSLLELANSSTAPILSLETPSGLGTMFGQVFTPHVEAAATLALMLPRQGLRHPAAAAACGDLYVADIGVPTMLLADLGVPMPPLFGRDSLVRLYVEDGKFWVRE